MSQWYYRKGSTRFGPVSEAELKRLLASGELKSGDTVRSGNMTEWKPAIEVDGLMPIDPMSKKVDAIFADLLGPPKPVPQQAS